MSKCPNCGNTLSCGCQRKKASDGNTVCRSCVNAYEMKLKENNEQTTSTQTPQVWGKDRYKNLHKFIE